MYDAIDRFLDSETWFKGHPNDNKRFFQALDTIVHRSDFDADQLGEHMTAKVANPLLQYAVKDLVKAAWAVREYLKATNTIGSDE